MTSATRTQRSEGANAAERPEAPPHRVAIALRPGLERKATVAVATLVAVAGLLAAGALIRAEAPPDPSAAAIAARYDGIPQDGMTLGSPDAPVTVVEFLDLQCSFCAAFARTVMPTVLDRYVRTGRVRLEMRTLAFLGQDSVRAAQAVAGAAAQDQAWPYVDRFLQRQGAENSGYVTEDFLRETAALPGVDADRVIDATDTNGITRAEGDAARAAIETAPAFLVGPTGGELEVAPLDALDVPSFTRVLDAALRDAR